MTKKMVAYSEFYENDAALNDLSKKLSAIIPKGRVSTSSLRRLGVKLVLRLDLANILELLGKGDSDGDEKS